VRIDYLSKNNIRGWQVECGGEFTVLIAESLGRLPTTPAGNNNNSNPNSSAIVPSSPMATAGPSGSRNSVFSWGDGSMGQLGHGDKASHSRPRLIESLLSVTQKYVTLKQP
jgi:hypothetical protein